MFRGQIGFRWRNVAWRNSTSSNNTSALELNKFRVLRMPSLSPSMKHAKLLKLHIAEGQQISAYDLCLEVMASGLTYGSSANDESWMEVEVIEDMYVAKLLCVPGEILEVDSPIALLCEDKKDFEQANSIRSLSGIHSAIWQAYVKSKNDPGACGCS